MRILFIAMAAIIFGFASSSPAVANVSCVQEFLAETSFDPGPVDGAWGRKTETAALAFFEQVGREVPGGVTRSNSDAICAAFSGPDRDELQELGKWRRYAIEIDIDALSEFTGKRLLDFSGIDVATDFSVERCSFTLNRRVREDGRIDTMASGMLSIEAGHITFGTHRWQTGGLADASYLTTEAVLVLDTAGQIHGQMPFFHLFAVPGQAVQPPLSVTLPSSFEPGPDFPHGTTSFSADHYAGGEFIIYYCRN